MRYFAASLLLVSFVVSSCAAPIPKGIVKDEVAIVGTWKFDKFDGGVVETPPGFSEVTFTFQEGKYTMSAGGKTVTEGSFKLDPEAKVKTVDFIEKTRTIPAIYELDGDTLKICSEDGANPVRPTETKSDGKKIFVITFKRVKEEKKEK